jgi:dTDP-6-deoxy-L-talose 4-dehydrogenase (NAD+)
MKVAVTGASGFIGKYVLNELNRRSIPYSAISRSKSQSGDQWVTADIHNPPPNLYDMMGRPDVLIHLAWNGLPNYQSLHHFETELPAQYKFLNQLIAEGLPSLVVTGTCFEYGMQAGALSEATTSFPTNPYGYAKDALRKQLEFLQNKHSFSLTWARLFYVYGNGQSEKSIWSQLKSAVQQGLKSFAMSGGEQLRDYLPIEKAVEYLVAVSLRKSNNGIVNICSGKPISVRRLVEQWIEENNWNIDLDLGQFPYTNYEPMAFWGDNTKLQKLLKEKQ